MVQTATTQVLDGTQGKTDDEIAPADLKRRLDQGDDVVLVDVRGPEEYEEWNIPGSVNVPLGDLQDGAQVPADRDQTVVTVCAVGVRSAKAQEILHGRGYEVYNLHSGMMGWNRVFNVVPVADVDLGPDAELLQVQRIGKGCLSYLVVADGEALVVDPARDWEVYREAARARGAEIVGAVDTHAHADHVSGGPAMSRTLDVPYHLHPYDGIHPIDVLPAEIDYEQLGDGDTLTVGDVEVEVLHIPGHTLGNTALLVDGRAVLTGDSVFVDSIARPDLGGEAETWTPLHYRSLRRLARLDDTLVLPGHFGDVSEATDGVFGARLDRIKAENEGLAMAAKDLDAFEDYILDSLPSFPERYVDIKRVNAGLIDLDEDEIQELEFGKQECALND